MSALISQLERIHSAQNVNSHRTFISFLGKIPEVYTKLSEIKRPGERLVFLDDYGQDWDACWAIRHTRPSWWNPIPMRHHGGTTLGFADGHTEW